MVESEAKSRVFSYKDKKLYLLKMAALYCFLLVTLTTIILPAVSQRICLVPQLIIHLDSSLVLLSLGLGLGSAAASVGTDNASGPAQNRVAVHCNV